MKRSTRRLLLLVASLPVVVLLLSFGYMAGMSWLEGEPRGFWHSLEWAVETLTTTGYGSDAQWHSPAMVVFVSATQFLGVFLVFLLFPVYFLPFFEERFEVRLATALPDMSGRRCVLVYHYGPAVAMLPEELRRFGRRAVVIEQDAAVARRLQERGIEVVNAALDDGNLDFARLRQAEALVANGEDHANAALTLIAREHGFEGPVYAMIDEPLHRDPVTRAGATAVYTPRHVLAAALAAKASGRISRRVLGLKEMDLHVEVTEMRIHAGSPLAGQTLARARIRERYGVAVVARWMAGEFNPELRGDTRLDPGTLLVVIGTSEGVRRLGEAARPIAQRGPIVIAGYGEVGRKIDELLSDAGERTIVIDAAEGEGVDVVGTVLDRATLERAEVGGARAVVLALSDDSTALFAAMVVRDFAYDVPLIARVNRLETVQRLYRVGTDFALSMGQVASQLLAQHMLGEEYLSVEPQVRMLRVDASSLAGSHPLRTGINERTGCLVLALQRGGEVMVEFPEEVRIESGDTVILCGSPEALDRCFAVFPELRPRGMAAAG